MNKYYIHCNNEQARYALISNAFYGRNTIELAANFKTASFLSDNFIFISKGILNSEILTTGTTEMFSPVIIELVAEDDSDIPVILAKKTDEGIVVSQELSKIHDIDTEENCIGAFVFGEIPVTLVSAFIFLNEKDKSNFRKPSPDLWFPQELFKLIQEEEIGQALTLEELKSASTQVDSILPSEKISELRDIIIKRNKEKAGLYFLVEATESWNTGSFLSNVDSYLVSRLDGESTSFKDALLKVLEPFGEEGSKEILESLEPIENEPSENINSYIFAKAIQFLSAKKGTEIISSEEYISWVQGLIATSRENNKDEIARAMQVINGYVYSRSIDDPDEALKALEGMPVAKSLMFFLDQQMNCDFLKNACKKLNQYERRYAYVMFSTFHGMGAVDGIAKKNRLLEKRIEDVINREYCNEMLISALPNYECLPFCAVELSEAPESYGIKINIKKWYSCEKSLDILLERADGDTLSELYKLFGINKLEDNFLTYKDSIVITISCGEKSNTITINNEAEAISKNTEVKRLISKFAKGNSKIDTERFKGYLSTPDVFKRYYAKYSKDIQDICGSLK